jgi:hypothetical protein
MAHNSAGFATVVADEFVAASSNSNKLYDKHGRMDDFDHAKISGVAPTPLTSARMFDFGNAVLMRSEHTPDRGKPLHVTRVWISGMEALSYQTSVKGTPPRKCCSATPSRSRFGKYVARALVRAAPRLIPALVPGDEEVSANL